MLRRRARPRPSPKERRGEEKGGREQVEEGSAMAAYGGVWCLRSEIGEEGKISYLLWCSCCV